MTVMSRCHLEEIDPIAEQLRLNHSTILRSKEIYYVGARPVRDRFHLGIVGSRRPTPESRHFIREIMHGLRDQRVRIISGGALGVDSEAHFEAVSVGLPTYAWIVGDPRWPTPHTNSAVFQKIRSAPGSAIISAGSFFRERSQNLWPNMWIDRNSWIAANCDLLIVTQAKLQSGSWGTVKICQEFGIEVAALGGSPLVPQFEGNNSMISRGFADIVIDRKSFLARLISLIKSTT